MRKFYSVIGLQLVCMGMMAQNPIIHDQFTADPTARVFHNRVYLYPSHDIVPPEGQRQDWFCMEDYHVFSSDNLTDWTDHGVIVTQNKVPWVRPDSYSMWAPDCVERNGKYYFYFPSAARDGSGFRIGVAVSDSPEGPFVCEPEPIRGIYGIDPCVLLASDGNAYIFWGNGRCAKLKENMKELADDTPKERVRWGDREFEMYGVNCLKDLPNRQAEGPFAFEYNGNYYLTYPYVRENTEVIGYAMSKSPMGPYEYKGIIMAEHPNGCWTNHHSIVNFKGQWYFFYHTNFYSPRDDKRRSVCIEKLCFNPDGTIQEIRETMRGVGINAATSRIEIDRYSSASADVSTVLIDTVRTFQGAQAILPKKGSWLQYNNVAFSGVDHTAYLVINAKAAGNTEFCIREKSAKGKVIARIPMTVITQMGQFRRDQSGQWLTQSVALEYVPTGVTDLVIANEGEAKLSVNWIQFKHRNSYFLPVVAHASAAHPDGNGFIRRWMLLEPINYDVSSNTILTESYLNENLTKPFFKGQYDDSRLPRDGEKVTAVNKIRQTLRWHAVESEDYHVKVFRFAEMNGCQPYNSLFWGVTIIDSPEERADVRLAVGSNGASMWWLNGERVLTLDGDRRMVEDDCMSRRLTLKKGRNVLRFALLNGPGLSDLCVRFIDEKNIPLTNFTIVNK